MRLSPKELGYDFHQFADRRLDDPDRCRRRDERVQFRDNCGLQHQRDDTHIDQRIARWPPRHTCTQDNGHKDDHRHSVDTSTRHIATRHIAGGRHVTCLDSAGGGCLRQRPISRP
ncbi:hypothetical protein RM423_24600 [Jatrophihabitans sp. DSM 44399]|uniref:Uncharacterized protein n=1 Tax=Jatrophihabitans lederbergiae TaxID=3075547 RepID=A0ABU2JHS4_9ACTN|nr:hypothetical protein [Jatrophihabitans sp. DSM 44399]